VSAGSRDDHHAHWPRAEHGVPQALHEQDVRVASAGHLDALPVARLRGGGELGGLPSRWPLTLGRPRRPVGGGFGALITALARSLVVSVTGSGRALIALHANAESPTTSTRRPR
jgi:hypothetical protein